MQPDAGSNDINSGDTNRQRDHSSTDSTLLQGYARTYDRIYVFDLTLSHSKYITTVAPPCRCKLDFYNQLLLNWQSVAESTHNLE